MEWKRFAPAALIGQIEQFERKLGIRLPTRFRGFLLSSNGGQPCEDVVFEVSEAGESVMLGCLYAIASKESGVDLEAMYEEFRDDLPEGFIPIGEDPGGNQLLLAIDGKSAEEVYFWDRVGLFAKRTGKKVFRIAMDIDGLLATLQVTSSD